MIRSPAGYGGEIRIKRYQDYYQASYGVMMLSAGQAFSPIDLFAASEPGVWYDPSDMSTLFQDAAGTTAVTGVEQPVGLMLDKSRGLVLGAELVSNGTFDSGITGWTKGAGTTDPISWDSTNKRLVVTNDVAYFASATTPLTGLTIGKTYRVTGVLSNNTIQARLHLSGLDPSSAVISAGGGTATFVFVASATSHTLSATNNQNTLGGVAYWDNISVRELPGSHASQSTSASRPVLSARYNLLTYTEQFDNAAWTKSRVTISANTTATTDPLGGNTADKIIPNTETNAHLIYQAVTATGAASSLAICAKAAEYSHILVSAGNNGVGVYFNLSSGTVGTASSGFSGSITSLGNGWYLCTASTTSGVSYLQVEVKDGANSNANYAGNGTDGLYIWGADLRVTNDGVGLPAYQRVGAATAGSSTAAGTGDYDTTGFLMYLRGDGVDDRLIGPAISNIISASAYEACFGARLLAVTTNSASPWLNNSLAADSLGYFGIGYATTGNVLGAFNYDGSTDTATLTVTPPSTFVLQQRHSSGSLAIASNGETEVSTASGDTSVLTGDFRLFSSNGSTSVNARLYGVIIRSTAFTAAERVNVLTWMNNRTKAF